MVTCQLKGGLGNNLFQMAACIAYASRIGQNWAIPLQVEAPHDPGQQPFYSPHMEYLPVFDPVIYNAFIYKEPRFQFDPISRVNDSFVHLDGYFQSEKYFAYQKEAVLKAFAFPWQHNKGVVSIQVRRGDYLEKQDYHPPVSFEYIQAAVTHFIALGYTKFSVFTDDPKWCTAFFDNFFLSYNLSFKVSYFGTPVGDLIQMSHCEHHIISNSSFGWWGAWLCQNEHKTVIAPKTWFGPRAIAEGVTDTDLVPASWLRM